MQRNLFLKNGYCCFQLFTCVIKIFSRWYASFEKKKKKLILKSTMTSLQVKQSVKQMVKDMSFMNSLNRLQFFSAYNIFFFFCVQRLYCQSSLNLLIILSCNPWCTSYGAFLLLQCYPSLFFFFFFWYNHILIASTVIAYFNICDNQYHLGHLTLANSLSKLTFGHLLGLRNFIQGLFRLLVWNITANCLKIFFFILIFIIDSLWLCYIALAGTNFNTVKSCSKQYSELC